VVGSIRRLPRRGPCRDERHADDDRDDAAIGERIHRPDAEQSRIDQSASRQRSRDADGDSCEREPERPADDMADDLIGQRANAVRIPISRGRSLTLPETNP